MIPHTYYETIHQSCLPGIWSKGVSLSRAGGILLDRNQSGEITLRVRSSERPISHNVTLWTEDEDWYCDCEARNDICAHVAAAVIFLKNQDSTASSSLETSAFPSLSQAQKTQGSHTEIEYEFYSHEGKLGLRRWVLYGQKKKERLTEPLTSIAGGISSGRIQAPALAITQEEYRVDAFFPSPQKTLLELETLIPLFKILSECHHLFFEGTPIQVSAHPYSYSYQLVSEKEGYRLKLKEDPSLTQVFSNGALLQKGILKAVEKNSWSLQKKPFHSQEGMWFGPQEMIPLLRDFLPELQKQARVDILTPHLPLAIKTTPEIVLLTHAQLNSQVSAHDSADDLLITPELRIKEGPKFSPEGRPIYYYTDPFEEKALGRKLQNELQLSLGQTSRLKGEAAVEFCLRLQHWKIEGKGAQAFEVKTPLEGIFDFNHERLNLIFKTTTGKSEAQPQAVLQAWRENAHYVKLLDGGWAPLPQQWLNLYGERIEALLRIQDVQGKLPQHFLPELIEICDDQHQSYPDSLRKLKDLLHHHEAIPQAALPLDLRADLRPYQQEGVNWLCFLRQARMGAMLADDMGLGKTLQALCAIQGKTLIICPTSVLMSWQTQIQTFRPELRLCLYSGAERKRDFEADVTLTSYGLVRLEKESFVRESWDTLILDEAQIIKNPESQISQVAHQLQGSFKIALSGTPIENQLEDLWSQFQFINPGLLGSREFFQDHYALPILKGDSIIAQKLQQRIQPFILRRLKKDVLTELPSKTEVTLYSELNEQESEVYQSLLLSTRGEVLKQLERGEGIFGALELLLRLRQTCCSISLLPDQAPAPSSKVELLMQTLEKSIAFGHRSLIFSQWTSYLDLIEQEIIKRKISFSRLDGTTTNRKARVDDFQSPSGPSVMLISLKAGGTGLTLTAADHVFIMDPWWNPAIENQAADRTHRIGQQNPVWVHRLIAQGTIEEKIHALQKAKAQLSQNILEDTGVAASLTREDILGLLC